MPRSSRNSGLIPFDPEPEKTFRQRRNFLKEIVEVTDLDSLESLHEEYSAERQSYSEDNSETSHPPLTERMAKLSDHSKPTMNTRRGFVMPPDMPKNFHISHGFVLLIERDQFGGGATEDPQAHIQKFSDYCETCIQDGVSQDKIRELMFPFSLRDEARRWITDLDRDALEIDSWDKLALAFYNKYFPPEKTNRLRSAITSFHQNNDENFHEAWERFKTLLRNCPHHGLSNWFVITQFYNGLYDDGRAILDGASNGRFSNIEVDRAWALIEEMSVHNQQYARPRATPRKSSNDSDSINSLSAQIAALCRKVDGIQGTGSSSTQPQNFNAVSSQSVTTRRVEELFNLPLIQYGYLLLDKLPNQDSG